MTAPVPPEVEILRDRLDLYLHESFPDVSADASGDFAVGHGSVITWVRPLAWTEGRTRARVWCITNVGMDVNGELTKYLVIANANILLGGFHLDPAVPSVMLVHSLLGEYLNRMELSATVASVTMVADRYAPEIKARFGGQLFTEA